MLFDEFGIRSYTGVNIAEFEYDPGRKNCRLICQSIHDVDFPANTFDVCFSIAAWEHIPDPQNVVLRVPKWLRTSGVHYGLYFSWSGPEGHHLIGAHPGAKEIPRYAQLLMSGAELLQHFIGEGLGDDDAAWAVDRVFAHPHINRVHTTEFAKAIAKCGLEVLYVDGRSNGNYIAGADEVCKKVLGLSREAASLQGLEFALRKSQFDTRKTIGLTSSGFQNRTRGRFWTKIKRQLRERIQKQVP